MLRALVVLGIALVALWALLWLVVRVAAGLVHLLVIAGVVLLAWALFRRFAQSR